MSAVGVYLSGENASAPRKMTADSCAYDISANEKVTIPPGERRKIDTGLILEFNDNLICWLLPKSGLADKYGLTVLNTPGTVDRDYRGTLKVIMFNSSNEEYTVNVGDRICQMTFVKEEPIEFWYASNVKDFTQTKRHQAGFGSTGK